MITSDRQYKHKFSIEMRFKDFEEAKKTMKYVFVLVLLILCTACSECPTCGVCKNITINNTVVVHDIMNQTITKTVYVNNTVYKEANCSKDRADWYVQLAKDQNNGYYDDFLAMRYLNCTNKLNFAMDYMSVAIGLYKILNLVNISQTYDAYRQAMIDVYSFCSSTVDGVDIDSAIMIQHNEYYNQYIIGVVENNLTRIFNE